ncbi:hypothetical protein EXIGLDRAFT_832631 [Exidia glandulosa HHB12029]|uniref:Uncharacterized protein n=1 Tax=Exidia glandulosa HHB12029 TaxID=1314781 RepID=A0A165LDV6_EXIGL|nr:hypothetical protein EXIGLDRAFT_832631 [Exidia glandulosa HHB12029]
MHVSTNIPDIPCASVFPGDSLEIVCRDITNMTIVLSRTRDGPSLRAALNPVTDSGTFLKQQAADRMSTLVTTGDADDPMASAVNAVTAHIPSTLVIEAAIVSLNTKPLQAGPGNVLPYIIDPIIPEDDENALMLLAGWAETRTKPFAEHLHDVVTIVSHISQTRSSDAELKAKLKMRAFASLIHFRAIYKLRARLNTGSSCWGKPPIDIIVEEVRKGLDKGTYSPRKFEIKLSEDDVTFVTEAGILGNNAEEPSRYTIDQNTIGPWLELLERTYHTIDTNAIPSDDADATSLPSLPVRVDNIVDAMPTFQILVRHLVPALLSEPLATTLSNRYDLQRSKATRHLEVKLSQHLEKIKAASETREATVSSDPAEGRAQEATGSSHTEDRVLAEHPVEDVPEAEDPDGDAPADDPGDEDAVYPEDNEDGGSLVTRYLKTLCAWWDAVIHVTGHVARGASLRVAHVRVNPVKPNITRSTIDELVTRYLTALRVHDHRARALAFFSSTGFIKMTPPNTKATKGNDVKRLFDLPPFNLPSTNAVQQFAGRATVHAEAALMGLMCLERSNPHGQDMKGFEKVFMAKPTVIGVSKKCCRTCWLLSQLLAEGDTNAESSSVFLPGTHAMLYPWVPPTGIPLPILLKLRERLFSIFLRITCSHDTGLGSTQSSPTLSEGPEPVVRLRRDDKLPSLLESKEALLKVLE